MLVGQDCVTKKFKIMESIILILLAVGGISLYFLPALICPNDSSNSTTLFLVNLVVGWTIIGWFICLAWALKEKAKLKNYRL